MLNQARDIGSQCAQFVAYWYLSEPKAAVKTPQAKTNKKILTQKQSKQSLSFNWFDHLTPKLLSFFWSGFGPILFGLPIQPVETMFIETNCLASIRNFMFHRIFL